MTTGYTSRGPSFRSNRLTIKLPSSVLTIKVGNSQELTSLRISGFDYNKVVLR